ncbi:MAG: hypothetical protein ACLFVE_06535 [Chitinispirillaceae bacterium]
MFSIHIIFIITLSLLLVSIIVATLNILTLKKTSARINTLELEMEKRAKQLDSIKKESTEQANRNQTYDPVSTSPTEAREQENNEDGIEIVRNVRDSYHEKNQEYSRENTASQTTQAQIPRPVICPLYNPNTECADFADLWNNLKTHIQSNDASIQINLGGIGHLHEKEIGYLHKMCEFAVQKGIPVILTECDNQLRSILYNVPSLYQLIRN